MVAKVVAGMTISLDGFVHDRHGSVAQLYPDLASLRETEFMQELIRTTGAVVMGRRAYEMANGDYTGYEFQVPIFVLTHSAPERVAAGTNDQLTFTFVAAGLEAAIAQAKAAAGDRNVVIVGGASTTQQCLNAGLADELQVDIRPVLFGAGLRLFEHLDTAGIALEPARVVEMPGFTQLNFRVAKNWLVEKGPKGS